MLEVAGRARGRTESWQKSPSPSALSARQRRSARLDAGSQKAAHQPVLTGQQADRGARRGAGPAAVRGGTHRGPHPWSRLVEAGVRGDRPRRLLRSELQAAAALVFAQALPAGVQPGPDQSRSYAQWLSQRPGDSDASA
jgi:hypothetical protein